MTTLTIQEVEASHLAHFDLGPGYPQLAPGKYVRRLYKDDTIEELSLLFAPEWSVGKQARVDSALHSAIADLLGMRISHPPAQPDMRVTFSGSIALDRILSACERLAQERGKSRLSVITTTPCIDIMKLFLRERSNVRPVFVPSVANGLFGALDVNAIADSVRQCRDSHGDSQVVVLLTSPENPTGESWSSEQLSFVAEACVEAEAVLVVDHSFLLCGVQTDTIARVWDCVRSTGCDYYAMWDTGKTFGLNEDKIGVMFAGDETLLRHLDDSVAVLQFGISRRQKLFFAELIRMSIFHDHLNWLRGVCMRNKAQLDQLADQYGFDSLHVRAGTLSLLDVSRTGADDETVRRLLLSSGIGVVAGNVFFHGDWVRRDLIRIALARDPEHFAEAASALFAVLNKRSWSHV